MKKLLFVISQFYKGGAEIALLNLLKFLDKSKYEADLIVMDQSPAENATSLISQLPKEIHILDVYAANQYLSLDDVVRAKLLLSQESRNCAPIPALLYAREHEYDWAFHVGEWWSPRFVAEFVRAKHKCAWLHTDISVADGFDAEEFFQYDDCFLLYFFVSEHSMKSSIHRYPFISNKSRVLYNISDVNEIKKAAEEKIEDDFFCRGLPVVLTLANIRKEKGHQRELEVMSILKERGLDFLWINIGSFIDAERCRNLLKYADRIGLGGEFILAGFRNNPYPYIRQADIIAVLSDYESWSMVISEAKILGKPIFSTRTSGALEQIEDRKNGLLADYDNEDIANKLEEMLSSKKMRDTLSSNLRGYDNTKEILRSFDTFLEEGAGTRKKEMLFIIDYVNYMGGAHIATKLQIREFLKKGICIDVFSNTLPNLNTRNELNGVHFLSLKDLPENRLMKRRLMDCLLDSYLSDEEKKYKLKLTYKSKIKKDSKLYEKEVLPNIKNLFSGYKTVCVMSEASIFRRFVAEASSIWKVQWIHTDYSVWYNQDAWSKENTENDLEIYNKFDRIVLLSDCLKDKFVSLYPQLESKTVVNANLVPVEEIRKKAETILDENKMHFITVGRIAPEKAFDRLFRVLCRLSEEGYEYHWTIVGEGEQFDRIKMLFAESSICNEVTFTGQLENPYPLMKKADVFALFSNREGLPNTVFESLILGVPVVATNVGGINSQIIDGKTGWLVENDEEHIFQQLVFLLEHPEDIKKVKLNLMNYIYDNDSVFSIDEKILCPEDLY